MHLSEVNDDTPEETEIDIAGLGLKRGIGKEPILVATEGQALEGSRREKVGACGGTSAGDV